MSPTFRSPGTSSVVGTSVEVPCQPWFGVRISACVNVAATSPPSGSPTVASSVTVPETSVAPEVGARSAGTSGMPAEANTTSRVAALPSTSVAVTAIVWSPARRPGPTREPSTTDWPSSVSSGVPMSPDASSSCTSSATDELIVPPAVGVLAAITGAELSVVSCRVATSPVVDAAASTCSPSAMAVVSSSVRRPWAVAPSTTKCRSISPNELRFEPQVPSPMAYDVLSRCPVAVPDAGVRLTFEIVKSSRLQAFTCVPVTTSMVFQPGSSHSLGITMLARSFTKTPPST